MRKAAFFDIDGTLIDVSKGMNEPSARVRAALRRVKEEGNYIFIASGRPIEFIDPAIMTLEFDGFVLMNGAVVQVGDDVVFDEPIERGIVDELIGFCDAHGIEYIFESHPCVYLKKNFGLMEEFFNRFLDVGRFVREFDQNKIAVHKMEFVSGHFDDAVKDFQARRLNSEALTGITDPSHYNNLELYSRKNTKGSGILHALEYLDIAIENSFAFGDGLNDLEMIQTVGCGCAMGNGNPKLKALAKHTVPSVHEDGVAVGIEKYILEATRG